MKKLILIMAYAGAVSVSNAQDWGPAAAISIIEPNAPFGIFNPTYCDHDSTLYFDSYCREIFSGYLNAQIFFSNLRMDSDGRAYWTEPQFVPSPVWIEDRNNGMPFIAANGDTMFYCSDQSGALGSSDIYMAVKINGEWSYPFNLGDSINTQYGEFKPCFVSGSNTLYFDRISSGNDNGIYKSELVNGVWQSAQRLPDIINIPGHSIYAPFYDPVQNILYFSDLDYASRIKPILKSAFVNGSWQEPEPLSDNINGFSCIDPDSVSACVNENAFMSYDRSKLFFNKFIMCGNPDYYSQLYVSERTLGIEDNLEKPEKYSIIESYPNPFNAQTTIKFNLSADNPVRIDIYDLLGRKIETLIDRNLSAGNYSIVWDASEIVTGVYFARMQTTDKFENIKLTLLK